MEMWVLVHPQLGLLCGAALACQVFFFRRKNTAFYSPNKALAEEGFLLVFYRIASADQDLLSSVVALA